MNYDAITTNFNTVITAVKNADIIIIEGFEFVGKHRIFEEVKETLIDNGHYVLGYRPDYDRIDYDIMADKIDRYSLRFPILEFFHEVRGSLPTAILVLDKSIFTDLANSIQVLPKSKVTQIFNNFTKVTQGLKICVVHVTFSSYDMAFIANTAEVLKQFGSFDEYFNELGWSDIQFNRVFNMYVEDTTNSTVSFIKYYPQIGDNEE